MHFKKQKSHNLRSNPMMLSIGKITKKKEFLKLPYTHLVINTSEVLESLCKIFFYNQNICLRLSLDQS